jgi:hypothetical protein
MKLKIEKLKPLVDSNFILFILSFELIASDIGKNAIRLIERTMWGNQS